MMPSEPLPLEEAKRAAKELQRKTKPRDHIRELDQIAVNEVDRVVIEREKRTWPVDLIGGSQRGVVDPVLPRAILDAEIRFIAAVSTVVGTAEEVELTPTIPSQPSGWLTPDAAAA